MSEEQAMQGAVLGRGVTETPNVRAKLRLTAITDYGYGRKELHFDTQYDDTIPEDRRFQKATPTGSLKLLVDNPLALAMFEGRIGQGFYLDLRPAEPDATTQCCSGGGP